MLSAAGWPIDEDQVLQAQYESYGRSGRCLQEDEGQVPGYESKEE